MVAEVDSSSNRSAVSKWATMAFRKTWKNCAWCWRKFLLRRLSAGGDCNWPVHLRNQRCIKTHVSINETQGGNDLEWFPGTSISLKGRFSCTEKKVLPSQSMSALTGDLPKAEYGTRFVSVRRSWTWRLLQSVLVILELHVFVSAQAGEMSKKETNNVCALLYLALSMVVQKRLKLPKLYCCLR